MGGILEIQPWITLRGASSSSDPIIQEISDWANTSDYRTAAIQSEILQVTGCTLSLQIADSASGEWETIESWTDGVSVAETLYLSRELDHGSPNRLANFMRWKIDRTSNNWETCFRFNGVFK